MMSHAGAAAPPSMSIPSCALSSLAVPIRLNHGSCIRIILVFLMLFSRACVTALHLHMFTETIQMGWCPAIRQCSTWQQQCHLVGVRGSTPLALLVRGRCPWAGGSSMPPGIHLCCRAWRRCSRFSREPEQSFLVKPDGSRV